MKKVTKARQIKTGRRDVEVETPPNGSSIADALTSVMQAAVNLETAKPAHKPTAEQEEILRAAAAMKAGDVLVIEAGAGAGKTSTLVLLAQALGGRGQYTAFNTALVKECAARFPSHVSSNTTHSLAFKAVGKKYAHRLGGARIKAWQVAKTLGIEEMRVEIMDGRFRTLEAGFLAGQVMGAVKRFCQGADRAISVDHFRYLDGIDLPGENGARSYANNNRVREYLLPFAQKAWADLSDPNGQLPFAHDHYVKVYQLSAKPVIDGDYILLDEAQDTAPVFLDVLQRQTCKTIVVGDSAQNIYSWRGTANAMKAYPGATRCYLSQSFRFGPAIASIANDILAKLSDPTPLRLRGFDKINSKVEPVAEPKAILCRTNGRAVNCLLAAFAEGKKPFLVGGGGDVVSFVEAAKDLQAGKSTGHPDLACFSNWGEVQDYVKQDEGEDLKLLVKLIDAFGPDAILGALRAMPAEKDADVVISTAHKSKGRQWESVRLESDFPSLSKCDDEALRLLYVAATRAQLVLDISCCPFFTGEDAMDITPLPVAADGVVPAAPVPPAAAPRQAPTGFTWAKGKQGDWLVRGPAGKAGETVDVTRRDGSSAKKKLGAVVWEGDGAALYKVG